MRVWVNGGLLADAESPAIGAADHGFTVGDGVFEAVKVVDGVPFALSRHLRRMQRSAQTLGLAAPADDVVRAAIAEVLASEHLPLGRLRITMTGGPAPLGSARGDGETTLVVATGELRPAAASVAAYVVPWPRNERGALAGVKSTSYAENVVALAEAASHGAGEAVFANLAGHLCEGTGSNIGYVVGGEVRTPSLDAGCLAGITRELLCEWHPVRQVDEPIEVLETAEEIFLMSTTRDVQPVHGWQRSGTTTTRDLPAPGVVTRRLQRLWAEREKQDPDP